MHFGEKTMKKFKERNICADICKSNFAANKKTNRFTKKYLPALALLCVLQIFFLSAMTLCGAIPQSAVEKNIKKCADFYSDKYMFQQVIKDENSTVIHNYADLVWLNIAWFQDSSAPCFSALNAAYYEGDGIYKSESLLRAVSGTVTPDKSYSRYWHGALIFIKPLLVFTDISGIRKINAAVCILCVLVLSALLVKKRLFAPLCGYLLSLAAVFFPIVPLCMEYMPPFLLMHIASVFVLIFGKEGKEPLLCAFFTAVGALICFFDFLTNEIITLFVPLIFLLCLKDGVFSSKKGSSVFKESFVFSALWLFGYAFTWVFKWLLCLVFLGKDAFKTAVFDGAYRMAGYVPGIEKNQLLGAITKNLNRLFPLNFFQDESSACLAALMAVFLLFCVFFLYRKEHVSSSVWVLFLIALTPYMRYLVLSNHSCLHPVFTFRTQIITVIAVFSAFAGGIDFHMLFKRRKKVCGKRN